MAENPLLSSQKEIKEQPVDQSLQLANEFFNALGEEDKELFTTSFLSAKDFSKELSKLSLEQQQYFSSLLKSNPEITTEISELSNINSANLKDILNRYKDKSNEEKNEVIEEVIEEKEEVVSEEKIKEEVIEEKEEVIEEKEEVKKEVVGEQKQKEEVKKEVVGEQKQKEEVKKEVVGEQKQKDILNTTEEEKNKKNEAEFIKFSDEVFNDLDKTKLPVDTWKKDAQDELLRTNPELAGDPQKLESYANAYVLLQNSEKILQTQPDLVDKVKQLQVMASGIDVFKNIESKKEAELIDTSFGKSDVLKRDIQQAKASLLPDGQELKIDIDGKVLTSGDQKLTFGDNGPKKEISRHGYSIDTTVQFSPDYKFKYESQNMRQLYQKTVADYKTAEANLKEVDGKVKEIDEKIAKADDDLLKDAYKAEKEQLMQTEVVSFQQQFDKQRQTLLEVYDQANAIDVEEKQRIPEYQNLQEQKDAQARETLDFLNNMGLTYIPQDTFEQLLTRINRSPEMYGFPRELSLESGLGGTLADKKAIKEGFYNLFTKLYEKIGIDLKGITVDKFINGTAGDQFKNQTFDTLLENPGGFKTKGTFNSATFIDFMLAPKESSEAKQ